MWIIFRGGMELYDLFEGLYILCLNSRAGGKGFAVFGNDFEAPPLPKGKEGV